MSPFVYLLNTMENAAQASDPSTAGYGLARRAVLEYVEKLEASNTRSESRDSVLKAIDDEPELPGEMPGEMLATLIQAVQSHDHDLLTETLRIVVRQTKEGIRERYLASVTRR